MAKRRLLDLNPYNFRKLTKLRTLLRRKGKYPNSIPTLANLSIEKGIAQVKAIFLPEE